ncbi:serine hydrolase domain-containing protein [Castellaniella hirudinis]|uniref:serine hydrolase domain-containing protein n=1 Tax=Castellaniella hirudinis TaxID=1144617 RepID=UPI0039C212A7
MKRLLAMTLWAVCAAAQAQVPHPAPDDALPGCAWARLQPGGASATGAWGLADRQTGRANDADTLFNIASVSKQFTALAVLLLAQDGQLDLDAPLSRYLPQMTGALGQPTLRQMLHHTSGLPDYISPLFDAGREADTVTVEDTLALIRSQAGLDFAPGTRFAYSNTGYFLLAQVVEHISGSSLAAFSRQYIFEPLNLRATTIVDRYPSGLARLARGYEMKDGQLRISESRWEQTGDGQVHTSARDLLIWLRHLDDDTPLTTPAGRATPGVLTLLTEGRAPEPGIGDRYRYGLSAVAFGDEAAWAHGGGWAGYRSLMAYVPGSHRGAAVLCNTTEVDVHERLEAMLQ